jgi:hypothetical protein
VHPIDNATPLTERTDAMTNLSFRAPRAAAFLFAFVASASVLGAIVAGMQPRLDSDTPVIAMEAVTVTATRVN